MANNININAGLDRTTASGPGPMQLPQVSVAQAPSNYQLAALLKSLGGWQEMWNGAPGPRQGGGYGYGTSALLPGVGAKSYLPPPSYSGASLSSAPQQSSALQRAYSPEPVRPPTYATPMGTPGLDVVYGGTIPATSYLGSFDDFADRTGAYNSPAAILERTLKRNRQLAEDK